MHPGRTTSWLWYTDVEAAGQKKKERKGGEGGEKAGSITREFGRHLSKLRAYPHLGVRFLHLLFFFFACYIAFLLVPYIPISRIHLASPLCI